MQESYACIFQSFANLGSQIGDERPISLVRFSPNSKYLATGSWAGNVKLWDMPNCTSVRTFRGHTDRVGGVAWHPRATLSQSEDAVNLVSGAADQSLHLWSLNRCVASSHVLRAISESLYSEKPLATMKGHIDRVARVAFHPSGNYVASASFDTTWRLWDVNTAKEVLLQEGHSKEVFSVEFQNDGALCASGYAPLRFSPLLTFSPRSQWTRRDRPGVGPPYRTNSNGPRRPRRGHFCNRLLTKRVRHILRP